MTLQEQLDTSVSFEDLGFDSHLVEALQGLGHVSPTRLQSRLLRDTAADRDLILAADAGTGRTLALSLLLCRSLPSPAGAEHADAEPFSALVLVPTRSSVTRFTRELGSLERFPRKAVALIGPGQGPGIVQEKLESNPAIVVGTPSRILAMHGKGLIPLDRVKLTLVDDVDQTLDIGFRDELCQIMDLTRRSQRTVFVTARLSAEIERVVRSQLPEAERIDLLPSPARSIDQLMQEHFRVEPWDKSRLLVYILKRIREGRVLVFCCDPHVGRLADDLDRKKIHANVIGDPDREPGHRKPSHREIKLMITSEAAAQGTDFDHITHIINFDVPEEPDDYMHRLGRLLRSDRGEMALSFVTADQQPKLDAIERNFGLTIPRAVCSAFEPGAPPSAAKPDPAKFPGGLVPVTMPSKRMGGRIRTRRS